MSPHLRALLGGALLACAPTLACAQSTEIIVTGTRTTLAAAQEDAATRPGGVDVVAAEEFEDRYAVSFRDTLAFVPGVIAQPRFGEEVRLSIRGSGLSNNAHLRGVEVLFDGVPINGADGFGDFQELDPLFASHFVVSRGANAFAVGSSTLGGAIELAALNARDGEETALLRAEAGGFESRRLHGRLGWVGERADVLVAATGQQQRGFRAQSEQSNGRLYLNAGWRWSARAETRFSLLGADINQEIPGALTLNQALSTPENANAANIARDYARNINSWRGIVRTTLDFGDNERLSFGAGYTDRHLHHPISIVLDQYVQEGLAFARWDGSATIGFAPVSYTIGARYRDGRTRQRTYASLLSPPGERRSLVGANVQSASGVDVFAEARVTPIANLDIITGVNLTDTARDYANDLAPATDDSAGFNGVSPKLGVLWRASPSVAFFANYSASFEPPTFSQLTQGGLADFYPIAAQEGRTLEIGARGRQGRVGWTISLYDARLENEFVSFVAIPGNPGTTRNAGDTVHRGVEAGLDARLIDDIASAALIARIVWTHNLFRFDADPTYGDNHLTAAPGDLARLELALAGEGWRVAPNVEWQSDDTFVDYANTLQSPGHTLWGVAASWDATDRLTLFLDARNLTDEAYVSMVSSIADATTPGANLTAFTPGDGRVIFLGARLRLSGQ
jgi:iron complex outermembrane receptor protein